MKNALCDLKILNRWNLLWLEAQLVLCVLLLPVLHGARLVLQVPRLPLEGHLQVLESNLKEELDLKERDAELYKISCLRRKHL